MCDIGSEINVGELVYEPPRDGPTLWEIGIPDRSAAEFYVPDPNPLYVNRLYVNHSDRYKSCRIAQCTFLCVFKTEINLAHALIFFIQ